MRTLAALLFIAGTAAVAVVLARQPTIADGRVLAAGLLEDVRKDGVTRMECDPQVQIGRQGAAFRCVATLADGATQVVDYTLTASGEYRARPQPPTRASRSRNPAQHDPWADRP